MPSPLDSSLCQQLGKYVETLTHTGQKTLDKDILKKLKNICRKSDGYVEHTYHLLIYQLEKAHAEIRYSAFQLCDELFRRSHCFRELFVSNLQHVMALTCETSDLPLPPPRSVAHSLKRFALQTIQEWNKEYGDGYKKLQLGYNFLKHCKKVDFNTLQMENSAERARQQEQERRQNFINQEKLKSIMAEINEVQPEIMNTLTTLENCISLVLPTPEDFFIQDADEQETETKMCNTEPSDGLPTHQKSDKNEYNVDEKIEKCNTEPKDSSYTDKKPDTNECGINQKTKKYIREPKDYPSVHQKSKKNEDNMGQKTRKCNIKPKIENDILSEKNKQNAVAQSKFEPEKGTELRKGDISKDECNKCNAENERISEDVKNVKQDPNTSPPNTPENNKEEEDYMEVETSDSESDISATEEGIDFREYGIVNPKYNIEVNVNTDSTSIKETDENAPIFENAKDMYILIRNRYLPTIKKWIQVITKTSGQSDSLKKMLDLKQSLEKATNKYLQLKDQAMANNSGESSDSDFEEVKEKEGYEEKVKEEIPIAGPSGAAVFGTKKPIKAGSQWNIWSEENSEKDPTSAQASLSTVTSSMPSTSKCQNKTSANKTSCLKEEDEMNKPSCSKDLDPVPSTSKDTSTSTPGESRKAKLLAIAPKIPFGIDLYHWEDDKVGVPTMVAVRAEGSRFWCSTQEELEEVPVPDGMNCLRTRVIEFTGKFEPVRWSCRAPLPNGKLCPRKDRYKCPFHGPIVPRDETGQCSRPEDAERLSKQEEDKQQECPDWQDPQLLEDIKQATGVDLKMPDKNKSKRGKKKKKSDKEKYPGLTDISARENTAHTRLSKKIFKRGTVKRVAKTLDAIDYKRHRDKYGDQFHYSYLS